MTELVSILYLYSLMKIRFHSILLASLLLFTISYAPIIYKVIAKASPIGIVINDCGEEAPEKSSEAANHETEQEEDSFNVGELFALSTQALAINNSELYPLGQSGHYPEVVSPPPKG